MNPRNLLLLCLLSGLTLSISRINAQELNFTHYTVESELRLPSNEVFGILFDHNNVLWATTERGVWRYDGFTSKQFTVSNGLKENSNLRIFCDSTNRILVSSINNYLYQIIGDSVRTCQMSENAHQYGRSSQFIQQIAENPDGSVYLSYNRPGLMHFKAGEPPEILYKHKIHHRDATIAIHYQPGFFYWDMLTPPDANTNLETRVTSDNGWVYITCGMEDIKKSYRKDLSPIGEQEFLFGFGKKAFHIKNGRLIAERTFKKDITSVYNDKNGSYWIGFELGGVMRFRNGDLESPPQHYLRGETITGITEDHEGSYWFASTTNGIFQVHTLDITLFENITTEIKDNIITALASDGENIYMGTQTGLLLKGTELYNTNYSFHPIYIPGPKSPVRKLFYTPNKHLIVLNDNLLEIDTLGNFQGIRNMPWFPFDYFRKPNGEWMASFTNIIRTVKNNKIIRALDTSNFHTTCPQEPNLSGAMVRARSMFLDTSNRTWIGSEKYGLFSSCDSIFYPWVKKDTLFGKRIHDIKQAGENIWVSIADYGIAVIHPDSSFIRITEKDGLSSDIIDVLFVENDEVVWAGTNNGLNRITLKPGSQKPDKIDYITMREGLPSNRIYQIIKHKYCIWAATLHGAVRLNPGFSEPSEILPKVIAGPLLVNGKPRDLSDSLVLGPDQNDLVIKYKVVSYRKPVSIRFRYKLTGIDKDYIVTTNREARYPDLPYGKYTFNVNATYNGGFNPANEKMFYIEIQRHWYQTILARIISGLMIAAFILLIFVHILKLTKKREKEKRQLLQAEKRALLSQMNPHFIFNSLNSIQHFIIQNDDIQANNYLTNFSGLIRKILENSKKNLIPLNEEFATLSLYLSMEKLRFENGFEYQINKDNRIDYNNTMIPPMLIQPLLENAIWHGLMPLKSEGNLKVLFTCEGDYFQVDIEDNGIGREKAAQIKVNKDPHISTGIQNIQERINLLNKINKKKITLIITDLYQSDGAAAGTSVKLLIPTDLNI